MSDLLRRVYELMDKRGIKPTQLARELGLSNSAFTDWGRGRGNPSLKAVMQFAEYFGVSIDYLVYGKENTSEKLDFSSKDDISLLENFHKLSPELQQKALGYIEGMAATMPPQPSSEVRLLG